MTLTLHPNNMMLNEREKRLLRVASNENNFEDIKKFMRGFEIMKINYTFKIINLELAVICKHDEYKRILATFNEGKS
jgi:hypothetical protein